MAHGRTPCDGCLRRAKKQRSVRQPKFCSNHQCNIEEKPGYPCTMRKKSQENWCIYRYPDTKCKERRCDSPRVVGENGVPHGFCEEHTCIIPSCSEGKAHDPRQDVHDNLCATHSAKICVIPSCLHPKIPTGNCCQRHTCRTQDCRLKVISVGRPFCNEHNVCIITDCGKEKCTYRGRIEETCGDHFMPPCSSRECCTNSASNDFPYCEFHSCSYRRCAKEAKPGSREPFCEDHKCSREGCHSMRNLDVIQGVLTPNNFCLDHECKTRGCKEHTYPKKSHCNSHCCTKDGCPESREADLRCGTLCFTHHEEKVAQDAIDAQQAELRQQEIDTQRTAEHGRRRERAEQRSRERAQPRPEPDQQQTHTPEMHGEIHYNRPQGQPGTRRPRRQGGNRDEGPRSNRNSGENQGW